jgi:hypothetical protein
VQVSLELLGAAQELGKARILLTMTGNQGMHHLHVPYTQCSVVADYKAPGQLCQELSEPLGNAPLTELIAECQCSPSEQEPRTVPSGGRAWRSAYMRRYRATRRQDVKRGNAQVAQVEGEHHRLLVAVETLRQEATLLRQLLSRPAATTS